MSGTGTGVERSLSEQIRDLYLDRMMQWILAHLWGGRVFLRAETEMWDTIAGGGEPPERGQVETHLLRPTRELLSQVLSSEAAPGEHLYIYL